MSNITPTLDELSKIEASDFFNFLQRKKISTVCTHCGAQAMQVAIEQSDGKDYLRLLKSNIINTNVPTMMVPQYMRSCGNCFSMHYLVALHVHDDIVMYKQEGSVKNDQY